LAAIQQNRIKIKNANETVKAILREVALDAGIELEGL
jgi:hypothetical protein